MPRPLKLVIAALCLATLAACDEAMTTTTMVMSPPLPEPAPVLPPPDPGVTAEALSDLPDPAVSACMAEVARVTRNGIVAPVSIAQGPLGQTVVIGVGDNRVPWQCRVDFGGTVTEVVPLT